MFHNVPVKKLFSVFQFLADENEPFDIWGTSVTKENVLECLKNNILESTPYGVSQMRGDDETFNHAARIAYLVLNKDVKPILFDVSWPSLGYYDMTIEDGNHRVVAAMIRGDETIPAYVAGENDYYDHLFVKPNDAYSEI